MLLIQQYPVICWKYNIMTSQAHIRCFVLVLQIFLYEDVSLTQQRAASPEKVEHNNNQSKRQTKGDQAQMNRLQVSPMLNHTTCQPQSSPSSHNTFHFVLIANRMLHIVGMLVEWLGLDARRKSATSDGTGR